jgi:hypothetical protein
LKGKAKILVSFQVEYVSMTTTDESSFSWAPTTVGACKKMQANTVREINDGLCRFILIVLVGQMIGA